MLDYMEAPIDKLYDTEHFVSASCSRIMPTPTLSQTFLTLRRLRGRQVAHTRYNDNESGGINKHENSRTLNLVFHAIIQRKTPEYH